MASIFREPDRAFDPMRALLGESDRGCILVGGAYVDEQLACLLEARFRRDSGNNDKLIDWLLRERPNPPLGSTGSKSALCMALGLISEGTYKAVRSLSKLRNERAAHFAGQMTFRNRVVRSHVQNMADGLGGFEWFYRWYWKQFPKGRRHFPPTRRRFMSAIAVTVGCLLKAEECLQNHQPIDLGPLRPEWMQYKPPTEPPPEG